METLLPEEHWENSIPLDPKLWVNNPEYLSNFPPRISKYAQVSDDACIQCVIDILGKEFLKKECPLSFDGMLGPGGNFPALSYAEVEPERVAVVAYLNELATFYDDYEVAEAEEFSVEKSTSSYRAQSNIPAGILQKAMSKVISRIIEIDPIRGTEMVRGYELWRKSEKTLLRNYSNYQNLEEYLEDRIHDVAWPIVTSCVKFGCKIDPTAEEEASVQSLLHLQHIHGVFINDYFSWPKELKAYKESGGKIPIRNAVDLIMRWFGVDAEEARSTLKERCRRLHEAYTLLKEELFQKDTITPTARRWLSLYEVMTTGNIIWSMTNSRYNSPGGHYYRAQFEKRCQAGAIFEDNSVES